MEEFLQYFSNRAISKTSAGISHLFAGALVAFNGSGSQILGNDPNIKGIMIRAGQDGGVLAMDAFGGLYVSSGHGAAKIDPETAETSQRFASVGECATFIESNARVETGWPLWLDWIDHHGTIEWPMRLVPITPFVLGGTFGIDNLEAASWEEAFDRYNRLSLKLHGIQDGNKISLE